MHVGSGGGLDRALPARIWTLTICSEQLRAESLGCEPTRLHSYPSVVGSSRAPVDRITVDFRRGQPY